MTPRPTGVALNTPALHMGEQLELQLRMPWNGVSPRYLTEGFSRRTIGGTGRAHQNGSDALRQKTDQREDLQLWLFEDGVI